MAFPVVIYNASTGSDTAASGSNLPTTALTGTNATVSGQVITLDGSPDLSSLADDGSDVIWFDATGSGDKHLFSIDAGGVNDGADQVTVTGTLVGSGVNWAIGGKRQSMENDTKHDSTDMLPGWVFEFEDTAVFTIAVAINPAVGDDTDGPVTFRAAAGQSPIFTVASNIRPFHLSTVCNIIIDGIGFTQTGTPWIGHTCILIASTNTKFEVRNCYCNDDMENGVGVDAGATGSIYRCEFSQLGGTGILIDASSRQPVLAFDNSCHDNDNYGIRVTSASSFAHCVIQRNRCYDNGLDGISLATSDQTSNAIYVIANVCHNNTGDGLSVVDETPNVAAGVFLILNAFTNNGAYGVDMNAAMAAAHVLVNMNNHYDGNTSGARNNLAAGENDTSGDPKYTSETDGAEDFTPAATSPLLEVYDVGTA